MHHNRIRRGFHHSHHNNSSQASQISGPPPTSQTAGAPRYHKLDFPKFDSKEDPLIWLNRCEQFFGDNARMKLSKFGWQPIAWLVLLRSGTCTWRVMRGCHHEGMPSWPRSNPKQSSRRNCTDEAIRHSNRMWRNFCPCLLTMIPFRQGSRFNYLHRASVTYFVWTLRCKSHWTFKSP